MSKLGEICMLSPRSVAAYGQDFLNAHVRTAPGFTTLKKVEGVYPVNLVKPGAIVFGENPDDDEESRSLNYLSQANKTVVFVHCQWDYYSDRERKSISRALQNCASGITPAIFSTDAFKELFPNVRWETVGGCVDTSKFFPSVEKERAAFRQKLGLTDKDILAIFVGRLEPAKGTRILRDLCKTARKNCSILIQYPAWQLIRENERLFQTYLNVCRELSNIEKVVFYPDYHPRVSPRPVRFADVCISPSLSEVQPLVLLEALASGVPFLATNSTPEYDELKIKFRDDGELSTAITTVNLPDYLRQGSIPRSADILASDSKVIADSLRKEIDQLCPHDDGRRAALSKAFLAHGFSVGDREQNLRRVLERAIWDGSDL